ncbi:MAG: hypothetical protein FJX23_04375 [Alphaproteobacteria bacterium]|nr:hypothetical protein [Alphaproteobacteria bacterium]
MINNPKAQKIFSDVERAFTEHPELTGETYLQHLWFTVKMGLRFVLVAILLILHGIFPFIFVKTASKQIEIIYGIMKSRIPKKRLEELDMLNYGYGTDI